MSPSLILHIIILAAIAIIAITACILDKKKREVNQKQVQNFISYLHSIKLEDSMSDIFTHLMNPTSSSILKDGTEKYEWVWSGTVPQKRTIIWAKDGRVTSVSHINI